MQINRSLPVVIIFSIAAVLACAVVNDSRGIDCTKVKGTTAYSCVAQLWSPVQNPDKDPCTHQLQRWLCAPGRDEAIIALIPILKTLEVPEFVGWHLKYDCFDSGKKVIAPTKPNAEDGPPIQPLDYPGWNEDAATTCVTLNGGEETIPGTPVGSCAQYVPATSGTVAASACGACFPAQCCTEYLAALNDTAVPKSASDALAYAECWVDDLSMPMCPTSPTPIAASFNACMLQRCQGACGAHPHKRPDAGE